MKKNKSFESTLEQRFIPPASTNLSERIIAAASKRKDAPFIKVVLEELMDMFVLPRPSYALAFCVIFGLFLGAQIPLDHLFYEPDYFSFLTLDPTLHGGEWL